MKFYCGNTNSGNVAVLQPQHDVAWKRFVLVLKTSQWIQGATFPSEICKTEVMADNAYAAAEIFIGEKINPSIGEEAAWQKQQETIFQFYDPLATAMFQRFKTEANAMTIGQLKTRFTAKQFSDILQAARRNNSYSRIGKDPILASALGDKLRDGIRAADSKRQKYNRGWKPKVKQWYEWDTHDYTYSLTNDQRKSPLVRFYYQLALNRIERARKKQSALEKRREPMRQLALHIARQMHRHKPAFGRRGDGLVYGFGHGNTGTKRRGGPGTRCAAGVTYNKGKITFYPTHNGKPFSIGAPPMKLRKGARPGIAHPSGLFCRASEEFPGVDENWDWVWIAGKSSEKRGAWQMVNLSIRGVAVSDRVARMDYTLEDALNEPNTEVRRVMLERLPAEAVAEHLKLIHQDEFGTLYSESDSNWRISGVLTIVKVVNSTPEPDGTFKDYYLRVPGTINRAKEAVAWTFGLKEDEYLPVAQS